MKDPGAHPNRRPLLALVLLSPVIAEMLSGSTPPIEWLNPIAVLFLIWLYGAGVLVMRETAVRWKTGWPSILLLGAAYGIIEEGLAVKSFFDPAWMDLGTLGWYGRWLDVNWVWAVWLTIFIDILLTPYRPSGISSEPPRPSYSWSGRRRGTRASSGPACRPGRPRPRRGHTPSRASGS